MKAKVKPKVKLKVKMDWKKTKRDFEQLLNWSLKTFPHLPWRTHREPYTTLVSEIMLQQTTVPTVMNYFHPFLHKFPTIKALARASEEEVLIAWKGLGYYRRARLLHAAARGFVERFEGKIPTDFESLKSVSGIGDYTAHALRSIGHDLPSISVDANLARVLARYFGLDPKPASDKKFRAQLESLYFENNHLSSLSARDFNESLMDLGRTYCTASKMQCGECPLQKSCQAASVTETEREKRYGKAASDILKKVKREKPLELHLIRVLVKKGPQILAYQKEKGEWLVGQRELPTYILKCDDEKLKQYPVVPKNLEQKISKKVKFETFRTSITKYKITNILLEMKEEEWMQLGLKNHFSKLSWISPKAPESNLSTASLKALK